MNKLFKLYSSLSGDDFSSVFSHIRTCGTFKLVHVTLELGWSLGTSTHTRAAGAEFG